MFIGLMPSQWRRKRELEDRERERRNKEGMTERDREAKYTCCHTVNVLQVITQCSDNVMKIFSNYTMHTTPSSSNDNVLQW
uniref:Uncharacterized protein n=1 Tax=Amphimedon queenslandica TaxID=400682 RepID=A0A1X7VS30_AMPQE